jgi:hypothetical protein
LAPIKAVRSLSSCLVDTIFAQCCEHFTACAVLSILRQGLISYYAGHAPATDNYSSVCVSYPSNAMTFLTRRPCRVPYETRTRWLGIDPCVRWIHSYEYILKKPKCGSIFSRIQGIDQHVSNNFMPTVARRTVNLPIVQRRDLIATFVCILPSRYRLSQDNMLRSSGRHICVSADVHHVFSYGG